MKTFLQKQNLNFSLKALLIVLAGVFILNTSKAQTNVSGGIFGNTTWTLANSPYIVTSNVVVFPGVTLTIQPGVVVKFDNGTRLEIRQGQLLAAGTATDSIIFTSNSATPYAGIYGCVWLNGDSMTSNFNYCRFAYADTGLCDDTYGSVSVTNSVFTTNGKGFQSYNGQAKVTLSHDNFINNTYYGAILANVIDSSSISYCSFSYNSTGLQTFFTYVLVNNCTFTYNQTGLFSERVLGHNLLFKHNSLRGFISGSENVLRNSIADSNTAGFLPNYDSLINCRANYNNIGFENAESYFLNDTAKYNTSFNFICSPGYSATMIGCVAQYSRVGVGNINAYTVMTDNFIDNNDTGMIIHYDTVNITCNTITNCANLALVYLSPGNINLANNYWGTHDSTHTQPLITDAHQNVNYGLVKFMPIDTVPCFFYCTNNYVQDICIVTTDTAINKNVIIWGRNNSPAHGSWNIYDSTGSGWVMIGSVPDTALSEFVDTASHPNLQAYSYRITTVDSCGESAPSPLNTSIYLQVAQLPGRDSLYWSPYVGFATPHYLIYRGPSLNALTLLDSVTGSQLYYVDSLPPAGSMYLIKAVNPGGPCAATHSRHNFIVSTNATISNGGIPKVITGINGISSSNGNVRIFPNPNNGVFQLGIRNYQLGIKYQTEVYNMLGERVYTGALNSANTTIDLSNNASGVYLYRIQTETGSLISEGKFVIQ